MKTKQNFMTVRRILLHMSEWVYIDCNFLLNMRRVFI